VWIYRRELMETSIIRPAQTPFAMSTYTNLVFQLKWLHPRIPKTIR
jgi:hypothetical protein